MVVGYVREQKKTSLNGVNDFCFVFEKVVFSQKSL
jgi:hypothetical protein